jgi:UDP-3-O-[3-hydroxymyristoyl] N-acetylglucosamine deacetylase / 3-hydroxyacyl-[acyl-carrier-protein] dehydratase
MVVKQKTLAKSFKIEGERPAYRSKCNHEFLPAPKIMDLNLKGLIWKMQPVIDADVDLVIDTSRGTLLENNGARIGTIEHALAALTGMDLDNVLIEVEQRRSPIMDGSSRYFVEAIEKAGLVEQDAEREYFEIQEKIEIFDEKSGSQIIALPDDDYR